MLDAQDLSTCEKPHRKVYRISFSHHYDYGRQLLELVHTLQHPLLSLDTYLIEKRVYA